LNDKLEVGIIIIRSSCVIVQRDLMLNSAVFLLHLSIFRQLLQSLTHDYDQGPICFFPWRIYQYDLCIQVHVKNLLNYMLLVCYGE
jgi:hypothetical protein